MEENQENLKQYISNPSGIARDFNKLNYEDLIKILNLNQESNRTGACDDAINFVMKLIEIKNQENLLKNNRNLVWATWFLAIVTILLAISR